jgi:CO/xanthine dehydrogenase Mo-binding subunit
MGNLIDRCIPRDDSRPKSGGTAEYVGDLHPEGMLYARTLRSTRPRARILGVRVPDLPDGCFVVDRTDVPGRNRVKMLVDDQPFFAEGEVNYIGEPILLLVGPDREELDRLLSAVVVEYEEREPIFGIQDSLSREKPPIYGTDNLFASYVFGASENEMQRAFREAAFVGEDEYETGYQEHIYMEPQGMLGFCNGERVTVYGSMQCPYYVKNALIQGLGWDEARIRVVQTTTGGAFGGKEEYPSLIAGHAAFAALKAGRPVQLLFDRREDIICTTKRHPSVVRFRTALDDRARIAAMQVDMILDGGAYAGLSDVVLQRALFAATGVYRVPLARISGKACATSTVPTGAFRGFGGPQAFFAVEMHMHHLALAVGEDPLDFKRRHAVKRGDATVTGGVYRQDVKLAEMTDILTEISGYRRKKRRKDSPARPGAALRGVGASLFFHGAGFTGSGEKDKIKAKVGLLPLAGGGAEILVSNVEMGQGAQTTLRKIVAETLRVSMESVVYRNPDTDRVPDSGPTVASRTVMIVGKLLMEAARELKARREAGEASGRPVFRSYRQPAGIEWDQASCQGDAYPTYSWGANAVEVEVDPLTYEIRVCGIWGVYDIGRAIDERIIQGQIEGGIAQGLGYGSLEHMALRDGRVAQDSVTDYIIPTSLDVPPMEYRLVDNPYEEGPYGAKGAGELPLVGAAPALAAAVQDALGLPIRRIPITPEDLMAAAEPGSRRGPGDPAGEPNGGAHEK